VEAGVLDIFRKPIDHEALLSAVRWALDQEVAQHDPTPTDPSGQPSAEKETAKASLADAGSASHATADETDAAPKGASALDGLRTGTTEELLSAVETAGGVTPEQTQAVPEPEVVLDEVVESAAESILIVEDETAIADTLRSALEPLSFRVSGVTTGAEAVSLIAVGDVDLILFDLTLPDLRVEQFYEAVKGVKPELCSRIIFMTSDDSHPADDGFVRRLKGISLWKPFPTDWLLEAVQAIRAGSQQDRLAAK
jgi:DNA-binding NtrC family response regulator